MFTVLSFDREIYEGVSSTTSLFLAPWAYWNVDAEAYFEQTSWVRRPDGSRTMEAGVVAGMRSFRGACQPT